MNAADEGPDPRWSVMHEDAIRFRRDRDYLSGGDMAWRYMQAWRDVDFLLRAAPSPVTAHDIEARGDEHPVPGESMPIESGGWWTPYTETSWGYFRFAIRPVEQPDGFLMFWHDADGAHTSAVILDPPAPSPVTGEAELRAALAPNRLRRYRPIYDPRSGLDRMTETDDGEWVHLSAINAALAAHPSPSKQDSVPEPERTETMGSPEHQPYKIGDGESDVEDVLRQMRAYAYGMTMASPKVVRDWADTIAAALSVEEEQA